MIDIQEYINGKPLNKEFLSGQTPPNLAEDSLDMLEWYQKQIDRVTNPKGFKKGGTRLTMFHYWFLNFTPFLVAQKDKHGNPTTTFDEIFPYWCTIDDYIFKCMEESFEEGKGIFLMGGRGFGKTYIMLSVLSHIYTWIRMSHGIVSASNDGHGKECFNKMRDMLDAINEAHPMLAQNRYKDNEKLLQAGDEITTAEGSKKIEGSKARIQKVIYGTNAGVTKGGRPDGQIIEEAADFAVGAGNLKDCLAASEGSWRVGGIRKAKVMMIGTGGTVRSSEAKDVFMKPDAYGLYKIDTENRKSCGLFIPTYYKYGGYYEKTGVPDWKNAKIALEEEREVKKIDPIAYSKYAQEFPFTVEEVFRQQGTNNFNQQKIASQRAIRDFNADVPQPEVGFLEWERGPGGNITGVRFDVNPKGTIHILERPEKTDDGSNYKDLYVMGVDSIDQGNLDSVTTDGSLLAALVKKRIVDGSYFTSTSNLYVAKYNERSDDVRWDYENVLKLAVYYNSAVNVEYTKIGIVGYFREQKSYWRLMKRPAIARADSSGQGKTTVIGTPASTPVIDHQDSKIKEYVDDYCHQIHFDDMLEQLQDYQRENRTKYDLVIAMGLCELADEDKTGIAARPENKRASDELEVWGTWTDSEGYKHYGVVPKSKASVNDQFKHEENMEAVRWIDLDGTLHFD